jgi:tRNA(fMet)-specific endonuclease VapC
VAVRRLCLDTSAYSHFMRGHAPAVAAIRRARWIGVPVVTLGELRAGFAAGRRRETNESVLASFLANPHVTVLDVDDEASRHYADIVGELRRTGTAVPSNDIWIAAVAAREGALVLTYDAHFDQIKRVGTHRLQLDA